MATLIFVGSGRPDQYAEEQFRLAGEEEIGGNSVCREIGKTIARQWQRNIPQVLCGEDERSRKTMADVICAFSKSLESIHSFQCSARISEEVMQTLLHRNFGAPEPDCFMDAPSFFGQDLIAGISHASTGETNEAATLCIFRPQFLEPAVLHFASLKKGVGIESFKPGDACIIRLASNENLITLEDIISLPCPQCVGTK